jgi:uncharacterized membrane protein
MSSKDKGTTAITMNETTAEALRMFAAQATGAVGKRVTLDRAVLLAVRLATAHLSEAPTIAAEIGIIPKQEVEQ